MKTLQRQPDPAAEEQASLWAARLEGGTLSAPDRDALDAWLNADASHRPLLSRYCQFSADLEEQLLALVATGGVQLPPEPTPVRPRATIIKWVSFTALAAAAMVLFAVWIGGPHIENISTAAAQRQTLTLGDGTRVELNARTTLAVELGRSERHVKLSTGEAFFSVSKDPSRPFIVETPAGSVRVTGTHFNVRAESAAELEVTVVEGSVQVRPESPPAPVPLVANDRLTARAGIVSKTVLSADELDAALAWRQGQIVLDRVPLRDLFERFAHYHGVTIIPSSTVLAQDNSASGRISIDDLESFLNELKASHNLRITHEPSGTIRVNLAGDP